MGVIQNIKRGILRILGKETEQKKIQNITSQEINDIDEKLERKAANKEADAKRWKKRYEDLKDSIQKSKEENVGKKLTEQQKQLVNQSLKGAISLKKVLNTLDKKKVHATSSDGGEQFGEWKDIWLLKNGQLAIAVETEEGKTTDIARARNVPDLINNYKYLEKGVAKGMVMMNLDEDGNHAPNPMTQRVPDIKIDMNGNVVSTQAHTEELQKLLAKKERKANRYRAKWKSAEEAWLEENETRKQLEDYIQVIKAKSDSLEDDAKSKLNEATEIIRDSRTRDRSVANLVNNMKMAKDVEQKLYSKKNELESKMQEMYSKSDREIAEEDVKSMISWIVNSIHSETKEQEKVEKQSREEEDNEAPF